MDGFFTAPIPPVRDPADHEVTPVSAAYAGTASVSTATVSDYVALLKPGVMSLVVFTGFAGLALAPLSIHPFLVLVAVVCIAIASGAAGAINMWYERDIDALMARTKTRPLPQGKIEPAEALTFGVVLSILSVGLMGLALNWVAAGLLALASLFYIFVYTIWLKRRTAQNIVIGGAAGAFPPMIGWAAVTGNVSIESVALFMLIFLWTPPHFWALALYRNDDYRKAGIPMLPVVAGARVTKNQIILYSVLMTPFVLAPYFLGLCGVLYLAGAVLLHTLFLVSAIRVRFDEGHRYARAMFGYSIFYLFAIFALMMADKV